MGSESWSHFSTVAIVVNDNAYGLTRDANILRRILVELGWQVGLVAPRGRHWSKRLFQNKAYDIVIHLETVHRHWLGAGHVQLVVPNQEWFRKRLVRHLRRFDHVLAKTAYAEQIFRDLGAKTTLMGFTSEDRSDVSAAKDWNRFFHLAGGSFLKGTEDILALWDAHPEWPELVLVQRAGAAPSQVPANVTLRTDHMSDDRLRALQNSCGLHLCPSRSEGWGHYIVEAMSCGAVVLATDAPPMNELITPKTGILVGYDRAEPRKMGTNFFVSSADLKANIERMIAMPQTVKERTGQAARRWFLDNDKLFRERVSATFSRN